MTTSNSMDTDTALKAEMPYSSRKFKASDLPLPSATRAAIESLAHSFKKEGAYDSIRKQVWDKFEASVCRKSISRCYFFLPLLIFFLPAFFLGLRGSSYKSNSRGCRTRS